LKGKNKHHTVFCDGDKLRGMTYGSFKIFNENEKLISYHKLVFGFGTSLEAEFMALINAINYCKDFKIKSVTFKTDSAEVVNHLYKKSHTQKSEIKALCRKINLKLTYFDYALIEKVPRKEVKEVLGH